MSNSSGRAERVPWRALVFLCLLIAYQILAHRALSHEGAAAAWVPMVPLLIAAAVSWRSRLRWLVSGIAAGVGIWLWTRPAGAPAALLMVHLCVYLGLLWLFARTLLPGREPLVSRVARAVRGSLSPELEGYTRRVTWAWSVFFGAMATGSCLLYALAPLSVWSFFLNFLNVPLVALMFIAEYLWRIARFPHLQHYPILTAVRAFRAGAGKQDAQPH